ncbi:hypothetical protein [Rhodovulum sulfidophilum]|uniref:hypothetical protein n=1 Tax=Rhodovulum sulfidophilum TaxID=35806 RepID=UPI00192070CF|nr:hypothetical protein [Rhodovulum sulfidophilum]MBL3560246.1 hypothetical protein [Rhodovulum sulfidophilum]
MISRLSPARRGLIVTALGSSLTVSWASSYYMRRYVCAKSMEQFAEGHISVVELAAQNRRLPGVEAVIQLDRGAKPLPLGPRANMIFRRSDVL